LYSKLHKLVYRSSTIKIMELATVIYKDIDLIFLVTG